MATRQLTGFASALVVPSGDSAYDTSAECAAIIQANTANASFTKFWEMTVPAQQIIRFGSGSPNQQRNQGYCHFWAADLGTDVEDGILRLVVSNARETVTRVVMEMNTQRLHTATPTTAITLTPTSIDDMVAIPEQINSPAAGEDSLLQLWFRTIIAGTTVDAVGFSIPCTIYQ
jgi:hypothetical protein